MQYLIDTNIKASQSERKTLNCVLYSISVRGAFYLFLGGSEMSLENRLSVNSTGKLVVARGRLNIHEYVEKWGIRKNLSADEIFAIHNGIGQGSAPEDCLNDFLDVYRSHMSFDKNGKVSSTSSKQYSMYVNKKSVKMTNETAKTKTNTWHKKTGELLRKYRGKTKKEMDKIAKEKFS